MDKNAVLFNNFKTKQNMGFKLQRSVCGGTCNRETEPKLSQAVQPKVLQDYWSLVLMSCQSGVTSSTLVHSPRDGSIPFQYNVVQPSGQ